MNIMSVTLLTLVMVIWYCLSVQTFLPYLKEQPTLNLGKTEKKKKCCMQLHKPKLVTFRSVTNDFQEN